MILALQPYPIYNERKCQRLLVPGRLLSPGGLQLQVPSPLLSIGGLKLLVPSRLICLGDCSAKLLSLEGLS